MTQHDVLTMMTSLVPGQKVLQVSGMDKKQDWLGSGAKNGFCGACVAEH